MTKPTVLETVESDFANELGTQRLPGQVPVRRPATGSPGSAATLEAGPAAERLQHRDQLASLRIVEARRVADVLEGFAVVDAERYRTNPLAAVAPAKPR